MLGIAVAAAVLRALSLAGLELYADEAYYWLWSLRPAAGYFDHPPMVAWVAALGRLLPGEAGLRAPFALLGGVAVYFAGRIAGELSDDPRVPPLAALLAACAPLLHPTGAMVLPDAPVQAAFAAATWLLARARGRGWLLAGAAFGLALLSKYTAALLLPGLLLLALGDAEVRAELRTAWPWLGALSAVAVFLPCLLWNATHGWVSIRFQLAHGLAPGSGPTPGFFPEFVGGQLAAAGPLVLVAGALGLTRARGSAARRVAASTLVPGATLLAMALRGKVEANWPTQLYPALAAGAAVALLRLGSRWRTVLAGAHVALGLGLLGLFSWEMRAPRLLAGSLTVARFHGGRELGRAARSALDELCGPNGAEGCFVVPENYQVAAELAYYAGLRRFGPTTARASQLDLWAEKPRAGESSVYVGPRPPEARDLGSLPLQPVGPGRRLEARFHGVRTRALVVVRLEPAGAPARETEGRGP